MSDGPSIRNHRITNTCFRTCSTCMSRSQAPLCVYTLRTITDRAEGTIALLRYCLGGDRPSQTTHQTLSQYLIQGIWIEFQKLKGGIPKMAPQSLAQLLQSLPPILYIKNQNPIPSCSKGSRGLFVLPRVSGIFTTATVSPSLQSRQCPSRYAIRAGRNLPD